jgi:uncharacterized protein (TIGR03118 family)
MRKTLSSLFATFALALAIGSSPTASGQSFYAQHNLLSDLPGVAVNQDSHTVNAWGLASSPTSPWWIANNGDDSSSLYNAGNNTIPSLVVSIPGGAPTGLVFNSSGGGFTVTNGSASASAVFIFASEAGIIAGWNPGVPPPPPSTSAQVGRAVPDAVYKGLAIAGLGSNARLYATNFHAGTVDVFDNHFTLLSTPGAFVDTDLPSGYAPFGIQHIDGTLYVTYALQDADKHDDVPGVGHGYVDQYDTAGVLLRRVASKGPLNSPWGLALAPDDFGEASGELLVGNFGDGRIHAYAMNESTGNGEAKLRSQLHGANGQPLRIDGLWALQFGNNAGAGPSTTLFFTSGPDGEAHGLFGSLTKANPPGQN